MLDGVIVIDKPSGWTSHDAVARVKATLRAKKVGHLGTLDPVATGVLPLVVNGATRFARILEGTAKVYRATLKLGEETDTLDSEGRVTETRDPSGLSAAEINAAFAAFVGTISQIPPMYSSVKRGGVPLYKLARKGMVVEREPKEVEIASIDVLSVALPLVEFRLACSRGTYVRTLCSDMGRRLGCGAHMVGLRREASGAFTLDQALSPESGADLLEGAVIPLGVALGRALDRMKAFDVSAAAAVGLKNAATVTVRGEHAFFASLKHKEMVRFVSCGSLAAVAEFVEHGEEPSTGVFSVAKVFKEGTSAADALRIGHNLLDLRR